MNRPVVRETGLEIEFGIHGYRVLPVSLYPKTVYPCIPGLYPVSLVCTQTVYPCIPCIPVSLLSVVYTGLCEGLEPWVVRGTGTPKDKDEVNN